jgi:redox-sensitive bicupin YhaK (pirin superfamily)
LNLAHPTETGMIARGPHTAALPSRRVARIDDPAIMAGQFPGHRARHLMNGQETAFTDPFLVLAEDWMPPGTFPFHPHRGMETVTFVLDGAIEHRDGAGHSGILRPGDAQWMTAGRGILHEENPPLGTISHTLQLWVNLPAAAKMAAPRYQDLRAADLPVRREPGIMARVFSGRSGDVVAPTLNHVPVTMVEAVIESGTVFRQDLPADDNAFIYVLAGTARVGDSETLVQASQLAWLTRVKGAGISEVKLAAADGATRVLIFAGPPLREPVVFGGPFVMNTQAEIRQAFADYQAGRF